MKAKKLISAARALSKAKALRRRTPLVVGWAITDRCNRRCLYCSRWQGKEKELSTEQIFGIINTLARMGSVRISLTGGEPLLREDIGEIIDFIHTKSIETKLNSNGGLVKKRIKELRNLDILSLSLEGPEEIQDAIRGRGSYQETIEAASIAIENGIRVAFATVLTRTNLGYVDFILNKARQIKGNVTFQPATELVLGGLAPNPMTPPEDEYRGTIKGLIDKKRKGDKVIANSIVALRHLYNWPNPRIIKCASGWISCRIEPNGDVIYCSRAKQPSQIFNCIQGGFQKAFHNLKPISCNNCWCTNRVELNLAFSGNLSVIYNKIR